MATRSPKAEPDGTPAERNQAELLEAERHERHLKGDERHHDDAAGSRAVTPDVPRAPRPEEEV